MTSQDRSVAPKLIVDATVILSTRPSGIGHYAMGIVKAFDALASRGLLSYSLLAAKSALPYADALGLHNRDRCIALHPLKKNLSRQILKRALPVAMDRIMPAGAYYFPAFNMLPLRQRPSAVVIHDMAHVDTQSCVAQGNVAQLAYTLPFAITHAHSIVTVSTFSKNRM